ncbi:hypothetical protein BDQ17DRAFT_1432803 [Cyathus striatus]|nr:hypothetical protein BDQ17DRAFT_1432803 [Cyathus striatus]
MANFNNPHHFGIYVGRDFNQVDNSNRGHLELKTLVSAACPGAGHESAERADPPKCHPNTRLTVISEIMEWVDSEDLTKRIMWLNGAAGVGKSAIAQTIAERCSQEGKLISSFFFSRTATTAGRNEGSRLIPTIAYHLVLVIPETKELVLLELDRDPGLLQKSMKIQLNRLIVNPSHISARLACTLFHLW